MATPKSAPRGGRFSASNSITVRNDTSAYSDPCALGGDGIVPGSMHIHPTRLAKVRDWVESEVLCYNVHNVQMGA